MSPLTVIAGAGVAASALWLIGLAALVTVDSKRASRFLEKFASSFRAHVLEQSLRLIAGAAFVTYSAEARLPNVFLGFGWVLTGSATVLLLLPWRLHKRFADRVIPAVLRHMGPFALVSLLLGSTILVTM